MNRPANIERSVRLTLCLPQSLRIAVDRELTRSGRVPVGAYKELMEFLLRRWLQERFEGLDS